jgi:7,8-dihydropterin-6-yl-methyl-4-(beta-D-ribofuranosyl)aminobenzene 5'-phosphate synthase
MRVSAVSGGAVATGLAALAVRYAGARRRADRDWAHRVEPRLSDIGEVDEVSILPLVERLTADEGGAGHLRGEAGLSYLVTAGKTRLLFDTGLNVKGQPRSALVHNANQLHADLGALDGVVISHLHADHVGGVGMARRRTFGFSADPLEQPGLPAYVPTAMRHTRATVIPTSGPRVIAAGVAVLPPLPAAMFAIGPVAEQALVVNVRRFGLVVITGCGHPPIERMLALTEMVLDVPIKAVIGGLHLPVHPLGTALLPQALLGNPHWPWQPISEHDADRVIEEIRERGPRIVALSGHDSTPWTLNAFADAFPGRYQTARVGEEIKISASSGN